MRWAVVLLSWGCVEAPEFASPWEDAAPTNERLSGWAYTAIDVPLPGAGWFRTTSGVRGSDFSSATVREVEGASAPVVVVLLGGLEPGGATVLELDIAMPAWIAGELPVDGQASIGQLRTPDGSGPFVIDGVVEVSAAGTQPGDVVEISFTDLVLGEVP